MSNQVKKPPVDINELNKPGGGEEHKKGPLGYAGNSGEGEKPGGGNGPSRGSTRSKLNYTQLVIAVGISVLLFFVISNFTLASKNDALTLLDNQKLLETSQGALGAQLNTETQRIENIIAAQAGFAPRSELQGLSSSITSIGNRLGEAEVDIEELDTRIAALEEGPEEVEVPLDYYLIGNKLFVKVSRSGWYRFRLTLIPENEGFCSRNETVQVYTKSHKLEAGEWSVGFLPSKLEDVVEDLDDYDIYVEGLTGISGEASEDEGSW